MRSGGVLGRRCYTRGPGINGSLGRVVLMACSPVGSAAASVACKIMHRTDAPPRKLQRCSLVGSVSSARPPGSRRGCPHTCLCQKNSERQQLLTPMNMAEAEGMGAL